MIHWLLALACSRQPAIDWSAEPIPPEGEPCAAAPPPAPIDRELRLRLLLGEGADRALLAEQIRRLAGYYAPYGLRFVAEQPEPIPQGTLLTDPAPAGVAELLAPVRALLAEHSLPARPGEVVIILLPALVADGSAAARYFDELDGMTLHPALIADSPALSPLAELGSFTPTILLSQADLRHRHPAHLDLSLAHELGHAAGLPHVRQPGNLMIAGPQRCVPGLDPEQIRHLRSL